MLVVYDFRFFQFIISLIKCVETNTAIPLDLNSYNFWYSLSLDVGSKLASGSSKNNSFGLASSENNKASFFFSPEENEFGLFLSLC